MIFFLLSFVNLIIIIINVLALGHYSEKNIF